MFFGCITALITPFKKGLVDKSALIHLLERQSGSIVVCGSTGEGVLLESFEREEVIKIGLDHAPGTIIVGCGAPSTQQALDQVIHAQLLGADAVLLVSPFYSKPQNDGIFDYFKTIHDQSNIPIILYNNPSRTGVEISMENVSKLAQLPRVIGIKESSNDMSILQRYDVPADFILLCGEDSLFAESLHSGAHGIISVGSNLDPDLYSDMFKAWQEKNPKFKTYARQVQRLSSTLSPNPSAIKYALHIRGLCELEYRSPLTEPDNEQKKNILEYKNAEQN